MSRTGYKRAAEFNSLSPLWNCIDGRDSRSLVDCLNNIRFLEDHGIQFVAVTQGLNTDIQNPATRFLLHVLGAAAGGHTFCGYVKWEYAPTGLSDLVAFFLRRIFALLKPDGFTAFITTNSIRDGDVRKDGLEQVLAQGGDINMAVRGIKWPGRANVIVSLVGIHKGSPAFHGRSIRPVPVR